MIKISKLSAFAAVPLALAAVLLCPHRLHAETLELEDYYGSIARFVADGLPLAHVSHQEFGDMISDKALNNYLSALDFDHSIFLAEDVESFRAFSRKLDDSLRKGHVDFAYDVFEVFKRRVTERIDVVESLLDHGFDLEKKETYAWKRKDAPWPASREEQDEIWRMKIKNEYVGLHVGKILQEEKELADALKPSSGEDDKAADPEPVTEVERSPEETILKKYRQFETVLGGHDSEWVLQTYLSAFTQAYDAHSTYLSPRATEDFDIAMKLSLTGIGAILTFDDGAAKIVSLIAGGPAERDGRLAPGDRIIAVAQGDEEPVDIMFWPLYKSVRLIRGKPGTKVILNVIPASDISGTTVRKISLVRDKINLEERAARSEVRELPGDQEDRVFRLGVITLPDFYADQKGRKRGTPGYKSSAADIKHLLMELQEKNVDGILLDLRNNGGGSLPDAVEMTGHFIDKGPIVQVKANRRVQKLNDPNPNVVYDGPLVVLVNRLSASASEILAAALQDYGRALIVGDTKTHGKGSVQSVFPLDQTNPKFGSLKITTAGFFRIDGRSTQLQGVTPDIHIRSAIDVMEIGEEYLPNVLGPSTVDSTFHEKSVRLGPIVKDLEARSQERQLENEEFVAYQQLVDRLARRIALKDISLNLGDRLAMAREDLAMEDFQETIRLSISTQGLADEDGDEGPRDLILDEALFILRDLIGPRGKRPPT